MISQFVERIVDLVPLMLRRMIFVETEHRFHGTNVPIVTLDYRVSRDAEAIRADIITVRPTHEYAYAVSDQMAYAMAPPDRYSEEIARRIAELIDATLMVAGVDVGSTSTASESVLATWQVRPERQTQTTILEWQFSRTSREGAVAAARQLERDERFWLRERDRYRDYYFDRNEAREESAWATQWHHRSPTQTQAAANAEALLVSVLTPAQRQTWEKQRYVDVGTTSGRTYRVYAAHSMNVVLLDCAGKETARYCAGAADPTGAILPIADHVYAQVVTLRCDENAFLRVANVSDAGALMDALGFRTMHAERMNDLRRMMDPIHGRRGRMDVTPVGDYMLRSVIA